jgi:hypothetical protein
VKASTYTCDHCGRTETIDGDGSPLGWWPYPGNRHACPECFMTPEVSKIVLAERQAETERLTGVTLPATIHDS